MQTQIEKIRSILKGNIGVMIGSSALWMISGNLTGPFYALYVLELGGDYAMIGKIMGISALIKIIPVFIGGYLTDRVGRRIILYTMTYMMAGVALIRAFAPDYRFLILAAVLETLFFGIRGPSMGSIIADSTDPEYRSLSYALWMVVPRMLGILSPAAFGLVVDRYGTRTAMMWGYIAIFVCGTISAYLRQRYITETLIETKEVTASLDALKELMSGFGETIKILSRGAVIFLLLDFLYTLALGMVDPYHVTFAKDSLGLSSAQWGGIMSVMTLVNCLIQMLVAGPSDSQGRVKFVVTSMVTWPITYYMFLQSGNYMEIAIARIAITIAAGVGQPAWHALFVDYCPKEHRGRYNALLEIAWSLLYGGGSWIGGMLYQDYGYRTPFIWSIALMAVGGFASLLFLREPKHKEG